MTGSAAAPTPTLPWPSRGRARRPVQVSTPSPARRVWEGRGGGRRARRWLRGSGTKATGRLLATLVCIGVLMMPAAALEPEELLADPALEARARALSAELRCLVCANQSIDDSNAPLAVDLRRVVRERLTLGDSDDAVMRYVTDRYGDYVRLRPPVEPATYAVWFGPPLILAVGAVVAAVYLLRRRRAPAVPDALTPEERRRVDDLLGRGPEPPA